MERDENGNPTVAILIGLFTVAAVVALLWYLCRGSVKKGNAYAQLGAANGNGADRKSEMVEAGNNWSSSSSSAMPFSSPQHHRRMV